MTYEADGGIILAIIYTSTYALVPEGEKKHIFEHQLALSLLSLGLKEQYHLSYAPSDLDGHLQKGPHGKPFLASHPDIHFNISHCDGLILCGFDPSPLGVDAEPIREFRPAILRRILSPEEKQFFAQFDGDEEARQNWFARIWTLKESYIKQLGCGFFMEPNTFSFSFDCSTKPIRIQCSDRSRHFFQQMLPGNYMLSACFDRPDVPVELRVVP